MTRPIRLLWLSESPLLATGFARVGRELLSRLARVDGLSVAAIGWGYDGWPYASSHYPYVIYPSSSDSHGEDILERVVAEFQPDIVITLAELWMIRWMQNHPARACFKWIAYCPLDAGPLYPPSYPLVRSMDEIVAMSHFGRKTIEDGVPSKRVHMIYHGVDPHVYRPLPNRELLKSHDRLQNRFVIGCVARNQPRKNVPALVKAFAQLAKRLPDVHLYLHMDPCDVGFDMVTLLQRYALQSRADISSPQITAASGLTDEKLNRLYNIFDVTVLPSTGEGFGLPILESMAVGVPVVATDCSACTELVTGRGELARPAAFVTTGTNLLEHAIVDETHLAECIEKLYRDPALRRTYSERGRRFAEFLAWDSLIPQWLQLIGHSNGGSGLRSEGEAR